jgi:hypothetical protein
MQAGHWISVVFLAPRSCRDHDIADSRTLIVIILAELQRQMGMTSVACGVRSKQHIVEKRYTTGYRGKPG